MSVIGVILVVNIILKVSHLILWSWLIVLWPLWLAIVIAILKEI